MTGIFVNTCFFLFKANCSIEVSPEFWQDKTKKSYFQYMLLLQLWLSNDQ